MKTIVIANQKGGVGKTTTAQHLSVALAMKGRRVLVVDMDKQHSLTDLFTQDLQTSMYDVIGGREPGQYGIDDVTLETYVPGLMLAPADERLIISEEDLAGRDTREWVMADAISEMRRRFDYVVIDTSPGLGFLLFNSLVAADEVVIPVKMAPMDVRGFTLLIKSIRRARKVQERTGSVRVYIRSVLPTIYHKGRIADDDILEALRSTRHPDYQDRYMPVHDDPVYATTLFDLGTMYDPELGRAQTIFELEPQHASAIAYQRLAEVVDG